MSAIHSWFKPTGSVYPTQYMHTAERKMCVFRHPIFLPYIKRARTHAHAHLHTLAFCSLSVLLLLLLLPSLLSLSMPFLPSMNYLRCCASYQKKKTKHKKEKKTNWRWWFRWLLFSPSIYDSALSQLDSHFVGGVVAVSMRWCCNGKVNLLCT